MGKASSAKKVARAARAGGNRRAGQRRALGFPVAIGLVIVVGLLLVVFAREKRNADAFPRANRDHVHSSIDIYTCVVDTSATTTTTTSTTLASDSTAPTDSTTTTTSTTSPTATTQASPNDVHGEYQPAPQDASQTDPLGIHSHGDGLIHIHPFTDSAAGRKATLGLFLNQVGISMTNDTLTLLSGASFTEGTTKCEGGKDGILQVAKWDHATDAAKGAKPNQIFTDGFDKIRLGENESFTIAFMPKDSTIPAKADVADRIAKVSDLAATTTTTVSSSGAPGSESSGAPSSDSTSSSSSGSSSSSDSGSTTTTTAASSSTSSSGP